MNFYYLDENKNPIKCNLPCYIKNCITNDNRVDETTIGDYWISTVFLCIDHSWGKSELPLLFETMIQHKRNEWLHYQKRYSTYAQAQEGHKEAIEHVKCAIKEIEATNES